MTETLAWVICKIHGLVLGHVEDRDGRTFFVRNDGTEPVDLGLPFAGWRVGAVRCSKCRRTRMVSGLQLKRAANASGREARVLV